MVTVVAIIVPMMGASSSRDIFLMRALVGVAQEALEQEEEQEGVYTVSSSSKSSLSAIISGVAVSRSRRRSVGVSLLSCFVSSTASAAFVCKTTMSSVIRNMNVLFFIKYSIYGGCHGTVGLDRPKIKGRKRKYKEKKIKYTLTKDLLKVIQVFRARVCCIVVIAVDRKRSWGRVIRYDNGTARGVHCASVSSWDLAK